ncbi:LacI family DNA-binding transcriptional regulator [Evansella sp. AB-P1]|uniref:LacI family DNA-binding transcriptional regulator n=1 Tax=Evansella sp. AB-P1 TaxID=3037653 RepID=UPI00241F48D6|nr:LacI family DNA-binding transcriptional regulator [Evansella sp. AB-P1]MDG5789900.1 LacI family DNA-binding transcriptional regulator [Evansella sp. AB-P1]
MKIKDIAKLANVSTSAVSLAINGKPGLSEATREKILKIAQEHGYSPRQLVSEGQKNNKILRFIAFTGTGIVSEKYENFPFFTELMQNLSENIQSRGYSLMISSLKIDNFYDVLDTFKKELHSDGIILLGTNLSGEQIEYIGSKFNNLVIIDTCFDTINLDFIVMNNTLGAYSAGKYLLNKGHKKIGYVESTSRMYNFKMRKKGFELALQEQNIKLEKKHMYSLPPTVVTSQNEFKELIAANRHNLPTALFCECDYMAISVIKSLNELGLRVPHDISVIGFDDIWEAQIINPELTTVHVPKNKIATIAVDRLIEKIENDDNNKTKVFVDTELVERNSCLDIN